jgi:Zn-finger nucleic acid-binding protein
MTCPACAAPMTEHTLGGHMGASVVIDVCLPCQAFWFDGRESLQLTPASTLKLFRVIGDEAARARHALPARTTCPRCSLALVPVEDMQRTTRFRYRRCPKQHGRFITFFDFLREKNFVKPLSAEQLADLRAHVQTVNCSNCGAPVDLTRATTCAHCQSPLSMLDLKHAQSVVEGLRAADQELAAVDPMLALERIRARRESERAFAQIDQGASWYHDASSAGTVGAGLLALGRWLSRKV